MKDGDVHELRKIENQDHRVSVEPSERGYVAKCICGYRYESEYPYKAREMASRHYGVKWEL